LYIVGKKSPKRKIKSKVMAPKRVFTRSHPNPEPAIATDNPERLLMKKNTAEVSRSHIPLMRSPSLPEKLVSFQDLEFDISFQQSLFRTKSDSFFSETALDQMIFQPRTPEILSPGVEVEQCFRPESDKFED
jgi:hypothetical protein